MNAFGNTGSKGTTWARKASPTWPRSIASLRSSRRCARSVMSARPNGGSESIAPMPLRKEMELKKELGHLVHVDDVRALAFRIGRQIRDGMLNIPDRLAAIIAAEPDGDKIRALLTAEIEQSSKS
jgi:hypothetical protein